MRWSTLATSALVWLTPTVLSAQLLEMRQTIFGMD
jgi:hypothetical protein